jgi:hypothetical protein
MVKNLYREGILLKISQLEEKQNVELMALKNKISTALEEMKPLNIIKRNLGEIIDSKDLKETVLANLAGLTTGFLSKAIITGGSKTPLKNVAGSFIQLLVSNGIARNPEMVMSIASRLSE